MTDKIDNMLASIEEGLVTEDVSTRPDRRGTVDYPGPYSDIARMDDEDARAGWQRVSDRSPRLNEEEQEELVAVFMAGGMSEQAARAAARGRN